MKKTTVGFLLVFIFLQSYSQSFSLSSSHFKTKDVFRTNSVFYGLGSVTLRPDCYPFLDSLASFIKLHPGLHLEIAEFTDFRGDAAANLVLSRGRARNVLNYLVLAGVDPSSLESEGYGETIPLETEKEQNKRCGSANHCNGCKGLNRRTEFIITAIKN